MITAGAVRSKRTRDTVDLITASPWQHTLTQVQAYRWWTLDRGGEPGDVGNVLPGSKRILCRTMVRFCKVDFSSCILSITLLTYRLNDVKFFHFTGKILQSSSNQWYAFSAAHFSFTNSLKSPLFDCFPFNDSIGRTTLVLFVPVS